MTITERNKYWISRGYENRIESHLQECFHTCWCEYCKESIKKGEIYFRDFKNSFHFDGSKFGENPVKKPSFQKGGMVRLNCCLMCLERLHKSIMKNKSRRKTIKAIKTRLMLDKLEEMN